MCSSPPPPRPKTLRKTYRRNGRKPQNRRVSRTIFSRLRAARSPSHWPTSPASTRRCWLPSTSNSWIDRSAGDDRRIDQRVIVLGAIVVRQAVGGRGHRGHRPLAPGRQLEPDFVRPGADRLDEREESGRAVQDDRGPRHPVRCDRPAIAGEPIGHDDLRRPPVSRTIRHRFFVVLRRPAPCRPGSGPRGPRPSWRSPRRDRSPATRPPSSARPTGGRPSGSWPRPRRGACRATGIGPHRRSGSRFRRPPGGGISPARPRTIPRMTAFDIEPLMPIASTRAPAGPVSARRRTPATMAAGWMC